MEPQPSPLRSRLCKMVHMMMRMRMAALVLVLGAMLFLLARPAQRPAAASPPPADSITMRVTFGYLRIAPKPYDGSVSVTGGRVRKIELWLGMQQDSAGADSWKLAVRRMAFENQPDRPNPVGGGSPATQNIVPAGIFLTVD